MKCLKLQRTRIAFGLVLIVSFTASPLLAGPTKSSASAPAKAAPAKSAPAKSGSAKANAPAGAAGRVGAAGGAARSPITTSNAGGGRAPSAPVGAATAGLRPAGAAVHSAPGGSSVVTRSNGRPADVHDAARAMDIHHNLGGGAHVDARRPDGTRVFYDHGRPGFVEHSFQHGGHEFGRRSYYYHGRAYDRFYNHYGYRGLYLDVYAPYYYYPFGFYGWAYNPWAAPVYYSWGFGPAPWYGYYGAYWTPAPVYATPSLWIADFMVGASLSEAYDAHVANQAQAQTAGNAPPTPMTPQTEQLLAKEVQTQIALENAEAQGNAQQQDPDPGRGSIERALGDGQSHVFVPGKELDLVDTSGQECAVTEGDVLQLSGPQDPAAPTAQLVVLAGKGGAECRGGATVTVPLTELQEMQNHMRDFVDQGLSQLQATQGAHGLPAAPASALAAPVPSQIAQAAPPPDPAVAQELAQQAASAEQSEKDVFAQTGVLASAIPSAGAAPGAAPAIGATAGIALGQTIDQVTASLGQPLRILNLGPRTVYVYQDMKITFKAGKVADAQ